MELSKDIFIQHNELFSAPSLDKLMGFLVIDFINCNYTNVKVVINVMFNLIIWKWLWIYVIKNAEN